jgi:hypothetical protein
MNPESQVSQSKEALAKRMIGSRKFWLTFTALIVYGIVQTAAILKGADTQALNTGIGIAGILAPSALSYVKEYMGKTKPNGS